MRVRVSEGLVSEMGKQSARGGALKRWILLILLFLFFCTVMFFVTKTGLLFCDCPREVADGEFRTIRSISAVNPDPLYFLKSKRVLLVSHELSLSGGPLLLMELAFLLTTAGAKVFWITIQKPSEKDEIVHNLEQRMLHRGIQILSARDAEAIDAALCADLVVLNTAVAGKWLNVFQKDTVLQVLPKVLWWIHEMRGHYFKLDYVKHLPLVAAAMVDSHVTAEYWKNRTKDRLGIRMPDTYVVHLGNSKELMEVAEDGIARRVMHEHIRELLGVRNNDIVFAIINSVSRGKGQDLFLHAFSESLEIIKRRNLQVPPMHALVVGSDMKAQPKFESELRNFTNLKQLHGRVHFINKTLAVSPYLAAIDVLVQNSQGRGECFGMITIEAMAFQLPVLGTAAGGTMEIVVNGSTGLLHVAGKEGIAPLAENMMMLAERAEERVAMGKRGYERVKEMFLQRHMAKNIALVLKEVLKKAESSRAI